MPRQKHSSKEERYTTVKVFDTKFAKRLSELLTFKMEKTGKEQLAVDFNVSKRIIESWIKREARPDIGRLEDFANYFDVSVDYLIGRSDISVTTLDKFETSEKYGLSIESLKKLEGIKDMAMYSNKFNEDIEALNFIIENDVLSELTEMIYAPFDKKQLDELNTRKASNGDIIVDIKKRYSVDLFEVYCMRFITELKNLREQKIKPLFEIKEENENGKHTKKRK
jgi:transcriptional regulator with XRE-family HTH domain